MEDLACQLPGDSPPFGLIEPHGRFMKQVEIAQVSVAQRVVRAESLAPGCFQSGVDRKTHRCISPRTQRTKSRRSDPRRTVTPGRLKAGWLGGDFVRRTVAQIGPVHHFRYKQRAVVLEIPIRGGEKWFISRRSR